MKIPAIQKLRDKLRRDECVFGFWVTLESASVTEMAVALGVDWVVIDAEHGHLDWGDIAGHLRATSRSDTVAVVRIAELNASLIKRALDIGADGVLVPWIETAEQLRQAVAFARYPPEGIRGIGAERATAWGQTIAQHVVEANANVLVIPLIESVGGGDNIEELLEVAGVDIFLFGPADYSSSAGYPGQWGAPVVEDAILAASQKIRAKGKSSGVMAASNEDLIRRRDQGFRLLGLGSDAPLIIRGLRAALAAVDRDRGIIDNCAP